MTKQVGVIAVDSTVQNAGAVTWWRLSGDVDAQRLFRAWDARGWDVADLPTQPSLVSTLRRVLRDQFGGPRCLIQSLNGAAFTVVDVAVVAADSTAKVADAEYTTRFKIRLDEIDELLESDSLPTAELAHLQTEYDRARNTYEASTLSGWLVGQVEQRKAIRLRDTGGIYFVPEGYVKSWREFGDVLAEASASRVYEVPAVKNEQAALALIEALTQDLQGRVAHLDQDIDDRGVRGLRSKAAKCEELAGKVRVYEALFSTKLDSLNEMVSRLDGRIVQAVLVAEAEAASGN